MTWKQQAFMADTFIQLENMNLSTEENSLRDIKPRSSAATERKKVQLQERVMFMHRPSVFSS